MRKRFGPHKWAIFIKQVIERKAFVNNYQCKPPFDKDEKYKFDRVGGELYWTFELNTWSLARKMKIKLDC